MKKITGLMWARKADQTTAQAVSEACARCHAKTGEWPEVALIYQNSDPTLVEVEGVEVRNSQYISSPRLVFVGWEQEGGGDA